MMLKQCLQSNVLTLNAYIKKLKALKNDLQCLVKKKKKVFSKKEGRELWWQQRWGSQIPCQCQWRQMNLAVTDSPWLSSSLGFVSIAESLHTHGYALLGDWARWKYKIPGIPDQCRTPLTAKYRYSSLQCCLRFFRPQSQLNFSLWPMEVKLPPFPRNSSLINTLYTKPHHRVCIQRETFNKITKIKSRNQWKKIDLHDRKSTKLKVCSLKGQKH